MSTNELQLAAMPPLDTEAMEAAEARWATRAKPPGALGVLETLGTQLSGITGQCPPPPMEQPAVVVFAADHGVAADGASAWPSDVTTMMVATMAQGQAAINVMASVVGASVTVVDVGVLHDTSQFPGVVQEKIRPGTASLAQGPAMSNGEAVLAFQLGRRMARQQQDNGADCLVGGEMGIGNTSPSTALISAFANVSVGQLVGPGAGLSADKLQHKTALISQGLDRLAASMSPLEIAAQVGGLEIVALAGLFVEGAQRSIPVVVDGVIGCAAACLADALAPGTAKRLVAGHRSTEPAATIGLDFLGLQPLLELDLRLGEGTGACLAVPLLQAAARTMDQMADLPTA